MSKETDQEFNSIAAATTPVEDVDRQIDEIASVSHQVEEVNVDEAPVNTTTESKAVASEETTVDAQDVSEKNATKPEVDAPETGSTSSEPSATSAATPVLKTSRKSVQIMTPKMDKNQSAPKRIDTPYPDEKSIHEATAKSDQINSKAKVREGQFL